MLLIAMNLRIPSALLSYEYETNYLHISNKIRNIECFQLSPMNYELFVGVIKCASVYPRVYDVQVRADCLQPNRKKQLDLKNE